MKRFFAFMALMVGCVSFASAKSNVAIFVFGNISDDDKFFIESQIGDQLQNNSSLEILERTQDFLDFVTQEQAYQMSGDVADNQICKLGKSWGAKYVICVKAVENRGLTMLTAKVIKVETKQRVCQLSHNREIRTVNDLIILSATLGQKLCEKIKL